MQNRSNTTSRPSAEWLANFNLLFDRDQEDFIFPVEGNRYVAVVHAFDRSVTVSNLGLNRIAETFQKMESGGFEYRSLADVPGRVREKETAFVEDGKPVDGMLCIMAADLDKLKEDVTAAQDVLGLLGMRMEGPSGRDHGENIENEKHVRYSVGRNNVARWTSRFAWNIFGKLFGFDVEENQVRQDSTGETFRTRKSISGGAARSMMEIRALSRNMGLKDGQPGLSSKSAQLLLLRLSMRKESVLDPKVQDMLTWHARESEVVRRETGTYLDALSGKIEAMIDSETNGLPYDRSTSPGNGEYRNQRRDDLQGLKDSLSRIREMVDGNAGEQAILDEIKDLSLATEVLFQDRKSVATVHEACSTITHAVLLHAIVDSPNKIVRWINEGTLKPGDDPMRQQEREGDYLLHPEKLRKRESRLMERARQQGINDPKALEDKLGDDRMSDGEEASDPEDGPTVH